MQDPAKNEETLRRIIEARDTLTLTAKHSGRMKHNGPDLDLSWCGSCDRSLRECLELSGCDVGKKIRAFVEESQRNGDMIVFNGSSSDRSDAARDALVKTFPRNRKERREEAARERRQKKPVRRRW